MKLNHNNYKEAMKEIYLSDEIGRELLEGAIKQRKQHAQRHKVQVAAIILGIMTVGLSANGICYAQTGKNVWELFATMYQESYQEEALIISEGAKESGKSITYKNLQFTLEYYWYDQENMEAYFALRTNSLDGATLNANLMNEDYYILPKSYVGSCSINSVESEDKSSILNYCYTHCAYDASGNLVSPISIAVSTKEGIEIGTFELEATGQMKAKNMDISALENCKRARISGAGISMIFEQTQVEENKEIPFKVLEVKMKDGTIYHSEFSEVLYSEKESSYVEEGEPSYDENGEFIGYLVEEQPENIHNCNTEFMHLFEEGKFLYSIQFKDFINVDHISAVYIDDIEIPLK